MCCLPSSWNGGAFISQHGSWNRSHFSGYKVVWVRFENGMPVGQPVDFLTEFMPDVASGVAFGRPVGLALDKRGNLLVADDTGGIVWRVSPVRVAPGDDARRRPPQSSSR
jgi:glucose/arabinose dehydrogenase